MRLNKYLPFESYRLESRFSVEEVKQRLSDHIQPSSRGGKPYRGYMNGDTFAISRVIEYRNSFVPVVTGEFYEADGVTMLKVNMRLDMAVMAFMCVWMGVVGMACAGILVLGILKIWMAVWEWQWPDLGGKDSLFLLIPFGMFGFGYLLVMGGFRAERKHAKAFLEWAVGNGVGFK